MRRRKQGGACNRIFSSLVIFFSRHNNLTLLFRPIDTEKLSWNDGKNSFPSMVQSASVIPRSRASPISTIPPSSTNASHVPQATNMHQANLDAPRRGGAKKSTRNICINCGTNTATLWRRIKSPEEIELKRPGLVAQREFPQYTGKLACNSCALYWSLHGVGKFLIVCQFELKI